MEQRANARYKEILKNYKEPEMDDSIRKELDSYMASVRNASVGNASVGNASICNP